jgi:tetratricopeptide (TPR) repeat protein
MVSIKKMPFVYLAAATIIGVPGAVASAPAASEDKWTQLQTEGTQALDANKYWIAEPMLKQAAVTAGAFGEDDLRLAKSFAELGRLYTVRGRFDQAEQYLEEELHVRQLALGKSNPEIIPAQASLIQFYLKYGTAAKADPLTEDMLSFVEAKLQDAGALSSHRKVTIQKGVALEAWAGVADEGARDPLIDWAIACDAVGGLYLAREKYDLAERLFKAALDIKSTILGKDHLSLANSYNSLGDVCQGRHQPAEAQSYYRDALEVTEKILPSDDPQVYARLDKLARCFIASGKIKEAEQLYSRARDFWKTEPCKNNDQARNLYMLGSLYCDEKNYEAAAPLLHDALQLAEDVNGPSSIGLVPYLQKYAYALYYLKRKPEVEELRARANLISGVMQ